MESKQKPYRVAKTTDGRLRGAVKLMDVKFQTLAEAEAWVESHRPRDIFDMNYVVVPPNFVKSVVAKMKAKTLQNQLQGMNALVATDFDDARDRLIKIADIADRDFAREGTCAPRKGWLKTELGLEYMFECMHLLSEKKRVRYNNLTPEELERRTANERGYGGDFRTRLANEYQKEFEAKVLEMATASLHADEY